MLSCNNPYANCTNRPRQAKACLRICGQRKRRSACASAQSDQGLFCPVTESLYTTAHMNKEQSKGADDTLRVRTMISSAYFAHVRRYFFFARRRSYVSAGVSFLLVMILFFHFNNRLLVTYALCFIVLFTKHFITKTCLYNFDPH